MVPLAAGRVEEGLAVPCSLDDGPAFAPAGQYPVPGKEGSGGKRKKEWPFDSGQTAVSFFAVGWEQQRGRPPWREEHIK